MAYKNKTAKEYAKEYYQRPEVKKRKKEYSKKYVKEYQQRPEVKERRKKYGKEWQRTYYHKNKELINERRKEYQKEYQQRPGIKEKQNENTKKYYQKNKNYVREYFKKYRQKPEVKFKAYKQSAKRRNIEFNLTFVQFILFWQKPCYYCRDKVETIGLDRVDNKKGYNLDNVVSSCMICNKMKMAMTKEEFINQCRKIVYEAIV